MREEWEIDVRGRGEKCQRNGVRDVREAGLEMSEERGERCQRNGREMREELGERCQRNGTRDVRGTG